MKWGLAAAQASSCDVAVVVDVLSFTTTLSVALDQGVEVVPYRWAEQDAGEVAAQHDAVLAVGRSHAREGQVSLSPLTVRAAGPQLRRLLLPSPNGASIAHRLHDSTAHVLGACLRNADAVAAWLSEQDGLEGAGVLVLAAGERWPNGQLRPAVEDLWGAGAVIAGLRRRGWDDLSVEAVMAADAYDSVRADLVHALYDCTSGRELVAMGFAGDVAVAGEVGMSTVVPALVSGVFRDIRTV